GRRANIAPMSSTVTVQPNASQRALNQSRTWRSRSVSVSRQMPPLAVPPILAVSINSSHSRSASMVRLRIASGTRLARFRFGELLAPILALENEGGGGHRQQDAADHKQAERDR